MSLITCPTCRQEFEGVYDTRGFCPRCGASMAKPDDYAYRVGRMDLRQVARRQRALLWYILISMALQAFALMPRPVSSGVVEVVVIVFFWGFQFVIIYGVLQLLAAMGVHILWRIICAILLFAPCINLITLLVINSRATRALRKSGLHVGFMGVRDEDVVRILSEHRCHNCGYSLTGNLSGTCPECGAPAPPLAPPISAPGEL